MALALDVQIHGMSAIAATTGSITSASFSTTTANEVLIAFVGVCSGTSGAACTVTSISTTGATLSWSRVCASGTTVRGASEIWVALATSTLSSVTITANVSYGSSASGNGAALSIYSFTGADTSTGVGASHAVAVNSAAPSTSLTTTGANSWVWGCGCDAAVGSPYTVGSGQTKLWDGDDTSSNANGFWLQQETATTSASGTSVTLNVTSPTSVLGGFAIVEILAASSGGGGTTSARLLMLLGCGS